MERKIGEIFEFGGEWYQCLKNNNAYGCESCAFYNKEYYLCDEESESLMLKETVLSVNVCSRNIGRMKRISFSMKGICCSQVMGTLLV